MHVPITSTNAEVSGAKAQSLGYVVLLATTTPDRMIPASAPVVQAALGASRALAFDVNAACAGFLVGLVTSTGLIAFVTNAGAIGTMTTTGRHVRRVTPRGIIARDPDWSPDGRHLVWVSQDGADFSIFVMDRRGRHVRRLTGPHPFPQDLLQDHGPAYSPNGERIVFDRCCFGPSKTDEIFVMHADGSSLRRLTHNRAQDSVSSWQPR